MTIDPFWEWATYHAALFGLDGDKDVETFMAWKTLFAAAGYTAAELREASDWIALNDTPKWRSEHLAKLQERIRTKRREDRARPAQPEQAYPDCNECHGTGWVCDLPHLGQVFGGEWKGESTCAVFCRCSWGTREYARHRERKAMTLDQYERRNPSWREQVERLVKVRAARQRAQGHSAHADKIFGPIMARIRRREEDRP